MRCPPSWERPSSGGRLRPAVSIPRERAGTLSRVSQCVTSCATDLPDIQPLATECERFFCTIITEDYVKPFLTLFDLVGYYQLEKFESGRLLFFLNVL